DGTEEASRWYNLFKTGAVDIKPAYSTNDNSGAKDGGNNDSADSSNNASLADSYKIMIDGENITTKMNLTMIDNTLYAEAKSYVDALTIYGNPILYCQDNQEDGTLDIYSWATDVVIMYIEQGTNTLYRLADDPVWDEYEAFALDEPMVTNENGEILVPVKAMTNYLISVQTLEASIEE
ncbi:MAG TPA: hypothetical protein VJ888_06550, partial [Mobilitalea sp.]|nr:hypothetical protein [Mobilitalea sp.]